MNARILKTFLIAAAASVSILVAAPAQLTPTAVTFNKDIAPLIYTHCAGCHRPGEIGPFPLLSFQDAGKRAKLIASVTQRRYMPPWKPEPGFGDFVDSHRLTDAEIERIQKWAADGAPEGNPKDHVEPPKFTEGWQLGVPDLVVQMPEEFSIPANGRDIYRCFVLPLNLTQDRSVSAVEFRPGNRKIVHHAILHLEQPGPARQRDAADPGAGYNCFGGGGVVGEGGLGGWAPGQTTRLLTDGAARTVRKGADLIVQNHYHPSGKVETDRSTVGIYFSKQPQTKYIMTLPVASRDIYIPAGDAAYKVSASFTAPIPMEITDVSPHMHLLGREMKVTATLPNGSIRPLVWIKDWDFNWQGQYRYRQPLILPAGTRIDMEAIFDNSAGNPRNPNNPPKPVRWGEQTTDEMAIVFLQAVSSRPADGVLLLTSYVRQQNPLAASTQANAADPASPGLQALVNNPEGIFRLVGRNSDTLSHEQFRLLFSRSQSILAQRPELADILFDQLDGNNNGVLTLEEFKGLVGLLQPGR